MPKIRKTKTASGATAIQVVRYENRKVVVMKHIGSGQTPAEITTLIERATAWITEMTNRQALFLGNMPRTHVLATAKYLGITHKFVYRVLANIAERCGFKVVDAPLLLDLAFLRIIEPTSKLRAVTLLARYFKIDYNKRTIYRTLPKLIQHKTKIEEIAVNCAKQQLALDLTLVLYDVTTLYFESFESDELRIPGFSKDKKFEQPQIVVGLLVTRTGFPVGYEVFKGNTFEGKTMLPVVTEFAKRHEIKLPIIVADAGMLSRENLLELKSAGFSYIVGARLANSALAVIEKVHSELGEKDGTTMRIAIEQGELICAFSAKRYRKDKAELEKQITKAKKLVKSGEPGKRARFVKRVEDEAYALDESGMKRARLLLGVKGYYTNVSREQLSDAEIIERYHDLWHVEAAFRMSKSDLATRPIFHYKEDAVRAHVLIRFVALVLGRYLELQTKLSLRRIVDLLWSVTEAQIMDSTTGEVFELRSELSDEMRDLLRVLGLSY